MAQEVTESLIPNSNHGRTSFATNNIDFATFVQSTWCTSR